MDEIFSKSRVPNSELFALNDNLVVQLLSSFDGRQIYPEPKIETKKAVFKEAEKENRESEGWDQVPDGVYYLHHHVKGFGTVKAIMRVEDGAFIVEKGSTCSPIQKDSKHAPGLLKQAVIKNNILQEDVVCPSPSTAGWIVLNKSNNGWVEWKNEEGKPIDIYRNKVSV